jgi:phosphoglycerol geranylgeranyltransferase
MSQPTKIEALLQSFLDQNRTVLAVLVDPDKSETPHIKALCAALPTGPDLWLCGGSLLEKDSTEAAIKRIRAESNAPIVLFPGDPAQVTGAADAILLLSLISGRNADWLIGAHVRASYQLHRSGLEILPTGYLLINSGPATAVSYLSNTAPIPDTKPSITAATVLAGYQLGLRNMYLEAGSGAENPLSLSHIMAARKVFAGPIWVGGGINTAHQARSAADAGATVVVVGTAAEQNPSVLTKIYQGLRS